MIASVLRLSRTDCEKLQLKDVYSIHKAIYSLFPAKEGKTRSFLFADKGGSFMERRILILSRDTPDKPSCGTVESKEIDEAFLHSDYYAFDVTVNPVKRDSKTGKIIPVKGYASLLKWFREKVPSFGFAVMPDSLTVRDIGVVQFDREKEGRREKVTLGKARFIGKLHVIDRTAFIHSFEQGLGKGKAFGFGLLQIVPITIKQN